ncbi:MAG: hypothetical protein A4S09_13205 [Proteobacteria bacterium SG_bin7]|nr:MAG: hypothetical protein A4S09_13205 [Proteobacteria bacterium SG_bin7]
MVDMQWEFRNILAKIFKVLFEPLYFKSDEKTRNLNITFTIVSFICLLSQIPFLIKISFTDKYKNLTGLYLITTSLYIVVYVLSRTGWLRLANSLLVTTLIVGVYSATKADPRIEILIACIPYLILPVLVLGHLSTWKATLAYSVVCLFVINNISHGLQNELRNGMAFGTILFCTLGITITFLKKYFRTKGENQRIMSIYHSRLASLSEMGAGIAHEINNPLTIIQGYASQMTSMIQRKQLSDDKVVHAAGKIIETSERIAKVVHKLRSFARDGENEAFRHEQVKVIVTSALEFHRARFRNHNIKVNFSEISPELFVNCRPVQLIQGIFNLLNNSFEAVSKLNEKWVQIDVYGVEDQIEIHVTDSGKGIDEDIAKKMYDPFFTTKDVGQASGLGLSITNSLVAAHGGKIYLNTKAKNTCFVITIPKSNPIEVKTKSAA